MERRSPATVGASWSSGRSSSGLKGPSGSGGRSIAGPLAIFRVCSSRLRAAQALRATARIRRSSCLERRLLTTQVMTVASRLAHTLSAALLPRRERERLSKLRFRDAGHGYDVLGLQPDALIAAVGASRFLYDRYFRVSSHGAEHIPVDGAAVLACNHSGMLPIDGAMIVQDVLEHTDRRACRASSAIGSFHACPGSARCSRGWGS